MECHLAQREEHLFLEQGRDVKHHYKGVDCGDGVVRFHNDHIYLDDNISIVKFLM